VCWCRAEVGTEWSSSVDVARVAIAFAFEEVVTSHLVMRQRGRVRQEGVEFRRERADLLRLFEEIQRLPQWLKTWFAWVRSSGLSLSGMVFVPNLAAPPGVQQISSASGGNLISTAAHTASASVLPGRDRPRAGDAWPCRDQVPAGRREICCTPGGAARFGTNTMPLRLSPEDRTHANQVFNHWGQSLDFFEKSKEVSPFTSKFDAFLANSATLTHDEMTGYNLFKGKGNCNSCQRRRKRDHSVPTSARHQQPPRR